MVGSDEQRKPDWDAYNKHLDELERREFSNTEAYDKAILTLSSAGLALSIAMIKLFSSSVEPQFVVSIIVAWVLFIVAIVTTVLSFLAANLAIQDSGDIAHDAYIALVDHDNLRSSAWGGRLKILTWTSGLAFILALVCVLFFAVGNVGNIHHKDSNMSNKMSTQGTALDGLGAQAVRVTQSSVVGVPPMRQVKSHSGAQVSASSVATQVSSNTPGSESKK